MALPLLIVAIAALSCYNKFAGNFRVIKKLMATAWAFVQVAFE
jgi:hypothetical protein